MTPSPELRRLVDGYRASQVLNVAMRLGLPDLVGDGARTSDELAIFDLRWPRSPAGSTVRCWERTTSPVTAPSSTSAAATARSCSDCSRRTRTCAACSSTSRTSSRRLLRTSGSTSSRAASSSRCHAYVLKAIVHDWEHEEAVAILRVVRRARGDDAALLVIERVLGDANEDRDGVFSDLNMLVMPGGRERTLDEFGALFADVGFRLVGATPTPSGWNVIEAAPA